MQNTTIKLQLDTGNLWRVITFTRSSQILPSWKFIKVTQRSRSNLVEILISRASLPVQLQHGAGKLWCIIIFTRSCKMLPFEHYLVQRSKRSDKGQHRTRPRFWRGEYLCKITKGYWQLVIVFTRQLYLELFESSKRSHKVQCRTHPRFLCREHPCKVTWYRQSTKSYRIHKVLPDASCLKVYKGHTKVKKFWWGEHHSLYSYNMMQAHFDALSYSQEAARYCHLNMTYFKRSDNSQHRTRPRFWSGEYLCKITKRYRQFLQSYSVHKADWPWDSLKVQKVT